MIAEGKTLEHVMKAHMRTSEVYRYDVWLRFAYRFSNEARVPYNLNADLLAYNVAAKPILLKVGWSPLVMFEEFRLNKPYKPKYEKEKE
ncbi:unnamed protein product [Toxocara canis]|uniref:Uncharacterized protein n=1 Tax=Toxocara canis TaxID=6265 RepID=A0A183UBD2_TOXCA|nr:unnamed protein product [Toxocara canis]